jgi:hypothetical protein
MELPVIRKQRRHHRIIAVVLVAAVFLIIAGMAAYSFSSGGTNPISSSATGSQAPNPCDIDLIKGTMSQEEAQVFVAKCPVAGKQAAQWLVAQFAANPKVYPQLEELQWELGPANYGHMRAGLDLFQYLYANREELGEKLAIAAANDKELAIDKQFLTLWVQASAWNAYPADVKMPWFNALAVRHFLARA